MDKIKTVKIKNEDGSISKESYSISVDAKNVDIDNGINLQDTIGTIDVNTDGNIGYQLSNLNINVTNLNDDIRKKIYYYDTIAAMKNDMTLKIGDCVCTLGYYAVNDSGAGEYEIINGDYTDDGALIHRLKNNLFAKLIIKDDKINAKQFGLQDSTQASDCHERMQYFLDYCGSHRFYAFFPNEYQFNITSPIVLKSHNTHTYLIKGTKAKTSTPNIQINCGYGFVGEGFPNSFIDVCAHIYNMTIRCSLAGIRVTMFKGINFYNSHINDNLFYFPYIFLEGTMKTGTYFQNNRIQDFLFCCFSSMCFKDDQNYNIDTIRTALANNNYDVSQISDYIIPLIPQFNDSCFCRDNYFAGAKSRAGEQNGTCIFLCRSIDKDFFIQNNWIEFITYVIRPIDMGINTQAYNINGTSIKNNVFQYFFRFFEPGAKYYGWDLEDNQFWASNPSDLNSRMTGRTFSDSEKCGILISNSPDGDRASSFMNIKIIDNFFSTVDWVINIDMGTGSWYTPTIFEWGNFTGQYSGSNLDMSKKIDIAYYAPNQHVNLKLDSLNDKYYSELPAVKNSNQRYHNIFSGMRIMVDGNIYIAVWDNSTLTWKQINNAT